MTTTRDPRTGTCGRCGGAVAVAEAHLAADGLRCLSCAVDENIEASADARRSDRERARLLNRLRFAVWTGVLAVGVGWTASSPVNVLAWGAVAVVVAWAGTLLRALWLHR